MEANPWEVIKKYRLELSLVGVGSIVFFNMLFNGFVWDDVQYIVNYPLVHFFNIGLLLGPNIYNGGFFYRPISALYFAFIYSFFNGEPFFFHVVQLGIHIANAVLLLKLFSIFFKKNIAFFLALIFLIHPITTEAVSYISTIDDPLFLFFGLLSMLLVLQTGISSWKTNALLTGCFLLILLTKETGVIFLLLSVLISFMFKKKAFRATIVLSVISVVLYGAIRIFTVGLPFSSPAAVPIAQVSGWERVYTMPLIFLYYVKTFFYPVFLAIDQQWVVKDLSWANVYLPALLVALCLGLLGYGGYYIFRHTKDWYKPLILFTSWFLLGVGMHMQIFPLEMTVADRWFYMPLVGLLGILGIFYEALHLGKKIVRIQVAICIVLIVALAFRTIARNANWTDPLTLYTHDEQVTQSYDLENSLATQLMQRGDIRGAFVHEQLSVSLFPGQINQGNLAVLYQRNGDIPTAGTYFDNAFSPAVDKIYTFHHDPRSLVYYEEFLSVYRSSGEAISSLHKALLEYPTLSELWVCLAIAEYRAHNFSDAEKAIDSAFSFSPSPQIYNLRTQIYRRLPLEIDMLATGRKVKII